MRELSGQVVVITGASSGIGRCTAQYLASRGAKVVVTARRAQALEDLVREIGANAIAVPGDVTKREDMERVAAMAVETFGCIDTWINNAGVYVQAFVQDTTLDEYRRVLEVNFLGLVNGTQCALAHMLPRGEGLIVQISSVAAKCGVPLLSAYAASKAAIDGFTDSLRAELWKTGIRFSIVYPQTVDTPIYQHGRGKLGVMPKPVPPIVDPMKAARTIASLLENPKRRAYFGWSRPVSLLNAISPHASDWLLHRVEPMTYSGRPAVPDNVDAPSPDIVPRIRGGWTDAGWKGLTLTEAMRTFPGMVLVGGAAAGFLIARALRAR